MMKGTTMKKKLLTLSSAVLLTASFSACANTVSGGGATEDGGFEFGDNMTLIVGYGAGSGTDTGARMMAAELEKKLGVTITVQNQDGAGGQVGLTALSNAECSGNTFGTTNFPSAIVSVLDEERGATYTRESFDPISLMVVDPTAIAVLPDDPIKTPEDLVTAAQENPGGVKYTTTGVASNEHFAMIALEQATDTTYNPVHFPDAGGNMTSAFLGGDVQVFVGNVADMLELEANGQARVIGVMEEERSPLLPDVPTFAESGYDVASSSSRGFSYPECAPDEATEALSTAIGEVMEDPEFQEQMAASGLAADYRGADEYEEYWTDREAAFAEIFDIAFEK